MDVKNSWLFAKPIAHRGLHTDELPENSLPAFQNAVKKGYSIELDVHIIDDGNLIVFHDDTLGRMTGTDGYASTLKTEDLRNLHLCGTEHTIPTFEEVLQLINGSVPILIETKTSGKASQLERKLCEMLKGYAGNFAVQSFSPYSMEYFKEKMPDIMRGQLSTVFAKNELPFLKRRLLSRLKVNKISQPHFVSYNWTNLPNKYVTKTNLPTLGWTVRSNTEYEQAIAVCDNIIFENFIPDLQK